MRSFLIRFVSKIGETDGVDRRKIPLLRTKMTARFWSPRRKRCYTSFAPSTSHTVQHATHVAPVVLPDELVELYANVSSWGSPSSKSISTTSCGFA